MFLFILLILHQPAEGDVSPISCYDDLGKSVDWFYLYKLPRPHRGLPDEGLKYLLMDRASQGWLDGKVLVNDSTGALGRTVAPLYKENEIGYILYNDQAPESRHMSDESGRGGHTKGVVLFDKRQGFWLVHSTPRFPPIKTEGRFSYPDSGIGNGQNFICVTYPIERFQTIGEQLGINQPHVYDCHIPSSLTSVAPSMLQLCKDSQSGWLNSSLLHTTSSTANRSVSLLSLAGTEFISFAKGASFDNDLYHAWVAPTLQSDLLVQFWQRSSGVLTSDCSLGRKVLNTQLLSPGQRNTFKATQDHSKWAVSSLAAGARGTGGGWVCVGDINRNKAEEKRGGGTVCLRDSSVWKAYRSAALSCISCSGGVTNCSQALGGRQELH